MNRLYNVFFMGMLVVASSCVSVQAMTIAADDEADSCLRLQTPVFRYRATDATTNGEVTAVQDFLIEKGFLSGAPSGFFGRLTMNAVKAYQKSKGVNPTGTIGSLTRGLITKDSCDEVSSAKNEPIVLACSMEMRLCPSGGEMPRDSDCMWRPDKCSNRTTPSSNYLNVESTTCTIPIGKSQCGSKISWSIADNTAGVTQMVVSGDKGYAMTYYQDVYSSTLMNRPGEGVAVYTLKNNSTIIDTKSVTSKCISGSVWNGSICQANQAPSQPSGTAPSIILTSSNDQLREPWLVGNVHSVGFLVTNTAISSSNPVLVYVQNGSTMWRICKVDVPAQSCSFTVERAMLDYFGGATSGFTLKACIGTSCATTSAPFSITLSENSPTIMGVTSFSDGGKIIGSSFYGNSFKVTINGVTKEYTTIDPDGKVIIFMARDFGLVLGNYYDVKLISSLGRESNSYRFYYSSDSSYVNPIGSIILESSTCTIPASKSQCGVLVSWSVTNPVPGKTEMIITGGFNYIMTQDSYSGTFYTKNGETPSTYTLKNNGVVLDVKTVTPRCQAGSAWNGSVCKSEQTVSLRGDPVAFVENGLAYTLEAANRFLASSVKVSAMATCVDIESNLHRGHEIGSVKRLQEFLVERGLLKEVTGFFGDKTIEAVKAYQRSVGLKETGMVYEQTREHINLDSCL